MTAIARSSAEKTTYSDGSLTDQAHPFVQKSSRLATILLKLAEEL